jgi:hypothetical protein
VTGDAASKHGQGNFSSHHLRIGRDEEQFFTVLAKPLLQRGDMPPPVEICISLTDLTFTVRKK